MAVKPIPDGYHTVTPYMIVEGGQKVIDFAKQAFGAKERFLMPGEGGSVMHAELEIGDSVVMIADATPQWKANNSMLYLYVEDCDAVYQRALAAGGQSVMEPKDQFYGDRSAGVLDPAGNYWGMATHIEDVSPEELEKRSAAYKKQQSA
jgi:PhnB protein